MSQIGTTAASMVAKNTMRPPCRSVQMPSGTRTSEPDSSGIAASRPNSVSDRPSWFLMGMPSTANIIHTAKQIVNAKVLATSTDRAFREDGVVMMTWPSCAGNPHGASIRNSRLSGYRPHDQLPPAGVTRYSGQVFSILSLTTSPSNAGRMTLSTSQLQRFFYSHYFFGGMRQAAGVLLPALVLSGVFGWHTSSFVAAVGAACVAILDQPGGPRRYGINGMFAALCLGSLTTFLTGLASSHVLAIWLTVPALCFCFSMLTVYGKHGGLLGFACLLIMTLTLRTPLTPADVLEHTLTSFLGGAFYLLYSAAVHRLMWHREEQQALSVALFATADYIAARARFYDIRQDLDDSYRNLIRRQALMTEAHQAARDMVLREQPRGTATHADRLRQGLLNLFVDMISLLDSMVATHTDYATLRRALPDSDILLFVRDAMMKLSANVADLALNVARNRRYRVRNSVKAELRALEFELQQLREGGMPQSDPELYALLVQVLRRLRNMTRQVDRMADHSVNPVPPETDPVGARKTLDRFLTRQKWRADMLTRNLNFRSAHCRYALRVAVASLLAMVVGALLARAPLVNTLDPGMAGHGYWIVLTVLIIMKPGFALTRQRNGWRLTGTLIGCGLSLLLFSLVDNSHALLLILVASSVLG